MASSERMVSDQFDYFTSEDDFVMLDLSEARTLADNLKRDAELFEMVAENAEGGDAWTLSPFHPAFTIYRNRRVDQPGQIGLARSRLRNNAVRQAGRKNIIV
ncbi:hypothetical protein [Roseovarius dicentrarchi]|uniref:hypothetical protein n=1 Tax=Roseovarius dicentrarchi TaxID=2250573 RepID=UPI00139671F1|nr:hypothetical protein [Roseovarius dicentrarchi]